MAASAARTGDDITLTSQKFCVLKVIPTQNRDERIYETNVSTLFALGHTLVQSVSPSDLSHSRCECARALPSLFREWKPQSPSVASATRANHAAPGVPTPLFSLTLGDRSLRGAFALSLVHWLLFNSISARDLWPRRPRHGRARNRTPETRTGRSLQGPRLGLAIGAGFSITRGWNRADVGGLGSFQF